MTILTTPKTSTWLYQYAKEELHNVTACLSYRQILGGKKEEYLMRVVNQYELEAQCMQ